MAANGIKEIKVSNTNYLIEPTLLGTCSTAANTAIKDATLSNFELFDNVQIAVKFTTTNTAAVSGLKLRVNSSNANDAKPIKYRGENLPAAGILAAGRIYNFIYDGTNWELVGDLDTNTDRLVEQGVSSTGSWRKLLLSGGNVYSAKSATPTARTDVTYQAANLDFQPSTGTLVATKFSGDGSALTSLTATNITGTVPFGNLPTGTGADKVAIGNHNHDGVYAPAAHTHNLLEPFASIYDTTVATASQRTVAGALKDYFNNNKTTIPRNKLISFATTAYSNALYAMGHFIEGYNDGPYGGFFVAHYQTPRYVGIANGSYEESILMRYVAGDGLVNGQVLVANGASGKVKTTGYTIAKSVPADAVFTDTNKYHTTGSWGGTNNLTYTASAVNSADELQFTLATATTGAYGVTKLSSATNSDSEVLAATPKAIHTLDTKMNGLLAAANAMTFKGTIDSTNGSDAADSTNRKTLPATHNAGDTYRVAKEGTYAGKYCEVGTLIICTTDGTTANDAHWTSVETNEDGAVIGTTPTSSTDNAIVRWDGTSGRIIQNSATTLNDNGCIKITHVGGKSQELQIVYGTTIDYWWGVGTANENHGLYDNKVSKWILSAGTDNKWNFDGNASSATTATTATTATNIKTSNTGGYTTDQYGNFKHQATNTSNTWNIVSNAGVNNFSVNFENGNTSTAGSITATNGFNGDLNGNATTATSSKVLENFYGDYNVSHSSATRPDTANIAHVTNGGVVHFKVTSKTNATGKPMADGNVLHFHWDTSSAWDSQLYIPDGSTDTSMQWRGSSAAGTWDSWRTLLDSANYDDYALPLTGGKLTGNLELVSANSAISNTANKRIHWYTLNSNGTLNVEQAYIAAGNNGNLAINTLNDIWLRPGNGTTMDVYDYSIVLHQGTIYPYTTAKYGLGDSNHKWTTVYADTFSGDYLTIPRDDNAQTGKGIDFVSGTTKYGHIGMNTGNMLGIYSTSSIVIRPSLTATNRGMKIEANAITPGETNQIDLGASNNVWKNVYATTFTGNLSGNATTATSASYLSTPSITTEENIEGGTRAYQGSGASWTGSMTSMQYAGILQVCGGYSRGWQIWAKRGGTESLHWRNPNNAANAWNEEKIILDSDNYTDYTVTKTGTGASGTWGISITGSSASCTGNAATATAIQTAGTTAQFYRGDNSWSNTIKQTANAVLGIDTNLKIGTARKDLNFDIATGTGSGINDGYAGGITWGTGAAAHAGIYCQTSGSYGTRLIFGTTGSYANGAYARMIIQSNGKVGIGTLSPDALLTVNGNGKFTGQIITSFKSSIAPGSYCSAQTTIPDLLEEVRYSSGCAGSFELTTVYTLNNVTLATGWYNFMYIPHRNGGLNGAAQGDNCNYGALYLHRMNAAGYADYVLAYSSGAAKLLDLHASFQSAATDGEIVVADGTLGHIKTSGYTVSSFAVSDHNHDEVYAPAVTGGYLPKSGGTMTGALNFANNTWNLVGDDVYLGDINKGGHLGIQGKNGNTGLFFTTYNQTTKTTGGAITWDGTKFSITSTTAVDASISGNAATASKISAKLATTTKTYLLGTATTITATAANVDITGDTGVYLTTTAGELSAARHSWNVSGTEKAYTIYNTTDDSIDFVFI